MQLQTASRLPQKMPLLLQGGTGTGKNFSALQVGTLFTNGVKAARILLCRQSCSIV